jgi:hypothetical protein
MKIERFKSDFSITCCIGKSSRYQQEKFGSHAVCAKSRLHASAIFKLFLGVIPQTPLKGEGREGKGKKMEGRERSRDGAGDEGTPGGKGLEVPLSRILYITHLTACTVYTYGPLMRHGCQVPSNALIAACPIGAPGHKYM